MSLRIREDVEKFTFYELSLEEKKRVVEVLSKALLERREVLLAVVFGGFVKYSVFRDIDVAVFTGYKIPYSEVEAYEEELSRTLGPLVGIPVDTIIVDYAPPWFRAKALEGVVLVEREVALAERLRFKSIQEVNDIKAKAEKAFKLQY
ncbi:MAG: nucleotidyltransferase domain-containing protein [Desulfurococcus sp.]|nr:nucleotidyltransferase domain-containing protein [Desulfurococcus sp.]